MILEPKKIVLHYFPIYMPLSNGTRCHEQNLSFKPAFSLSSFTIKRLFSFSLLSAIRVVSSVYLRLLICLRTVLIQVWSSSPAFHMLYSTYDGHTHMMYVIDISANNLDSSLWFIQPGISHDVLYMWWTWVWASSRSWWDREAWHAAVHGVTKSHRRDWATELNWTLNIS